MRKCKVCGLEKEYNKLGTSPKTRNFTGYTCYACLLADQKAWRGTEIGRMEANEASKACKQRKRSAF